MASHEIGFGLYDVRRPATSPTRRGVAKGRPQPGRGGGGSAPLRSQQPLTPSPPRALGASAPLLSHSSPSAASAGAAGVDYADGQRAAAMDVHGAARTATNGRGAQLRVTRTLGASTELEASASKVRTSPSPSPPRLSPLPHDTSSAGASSLLEDSLRSVVHLTGPPVLLPSLLEVLHRVLRQLQHDRQQRKGQDPRRRASAVGMGTDLDSEVVACIAHAAQAGTVAAAGDVLSDFLRSHNASAAPPASVVRPAPAAATASPVVLVGAALAELVVSGRVPASVMAPSALLSYLDAAVAAGHPAAMLHVGLCLRDGRAGVNRDVAAGLAWMRCAAAAGYLPAMQELGETFELGLPPPPAPTTTATAAEGDDAAEDGGVDWGEALRWYREAADAGYPASQLNLGKLLLLAGEQAAQDGLTDTAAAARLTAEATRWLKVCAEAGVEEAVRLLQRMKR